MFYPPPKEQVLASQPFPTDYPHGTKLTFAEQLLDAAAMRALSNKEAERLGTELIDSIFKSVAPETIHHKVWGWLEDLNYGRIPEAFGIGELKRANSTKTETMNSWFAAELSYAIFCALHARVYEMPFEVRARIAEQEVVCCCLRAKTTYTSVADHVEERVRLYAHGEDAVKFRAEQFCKLYHIKKENEKAELARLM